MQVRKECLFCHRVIPPRDNVCSPCAKEHKEYFNEQWYKDICKYESKQYQISKIESFGLFDDYDHSHRVSSKIKKNEGKPETSWTIINKVLNTFDEYIAQDKVPSLRELTKVFNGKVGILVIRNALMKYRSEQYKKYYYRNYKPMKN